jgi:hypothetical protein
MTDDTALLRRFLRTVRVATHTALAEYEMTDLNRSARAPVEFRALAAKGLQGWRFPDGGLAAADGLVLATVERDGNGTAVALVLQAQGAAGLDAWAGRSIRLDFGALAESVTRFDADRRARVVLAALGLAEDDLATFVIEPVDAR